MLLELVSFTKRVRRKHLMTKQNLVRSKLFQWLQFNLPFGVPFSQILSSMNTAEAEESPL